jgi:hypothetical protein
MAFGFRTTNKNREFEFHTNNLWLIDPRTANAVTPEALKEVYPNGFTSANEVTASGRWDEQFLEVSVTVRSKIRNTLEMRTKIINIDENPPVARPCVFTDPLSVHLAEDNNALQ